MQMNKTVLQSFGEQQTSPQDVKENEGSERAAELRSEDRRLKEVRGGYIYNSLFVLFAPV